MDRVVVLFYLSIISQDRHLRLLTPQGQIGLTDWDSDSPSCHDFPTSISRTSLPAFLVEHKHEEQDARDPAKLDEANSGSLTNPGPGAATSTKEIHDALPRFVLAPCHSPSNSACHSATGTLCARGDSRALAKPNHVRFCSVLCGWFQHTFLEVHRSSGLDARGVFLTFDTQDSGKGRAEHR